MASCQRPAVSVCVPSCVCVCAVVLPCICVHAACMWSTSLPVLSCVHPSMRVCVCVPSALTRGTVELLFPDGTGKQTLQGWQSWHDYPAHSWHCQPPCSPLCTRARVPAASRLSSLTDWQAVYQLTHSVVKVSPCLFCPKRAPARLKRRRNLLLLSCFSLFRCSTF